MGKLGNPNPNQMATSFFNIIPAQVLLEIMVHCNGKTTRALSHVTKHAQCVYLEIRTQVLLSKPVQISCEIIKWVEGNSSRLNSVAFDNYMICRMYTACPRYTLWRSSIHGLSMLAHAHYAINALGMHDGANIIICFRTRRETEQMLAFIAMVMPSAFQSRQKIFTRYDDDGIHMNIRTANPYRLICDASVYKYPKNMFLQAIDIRGMVISTKEPKATLITQYLQPARPIQGLDLYTCNSFADYLECFAE